VKSTAQSADEYVASLPEDRREVASAVRGRLARRMPSA
jgi:hypothetical protein